MSKFDNLLNISSKHIDLEDLAWLCDSEEIDDYAVVYDISTEQNGLALIIYICCYNKHNKYNHANIPENIRNIFDLACDSKCNTIYLSTTGYEFSYLNTHTLDMNNKYCFLLSGNKTEENNKPIKYILNMSTDCVYNDQDKTINDMLTSPDAMDNKIPGVYTKSEYGWFIDVKTAPYDIQHAIFGKAQPVGAYIEDILFICLDRDYL